MKPYKFFEDTLMGHGDI